MSKNNQKSRSELKQRVLLSHATIECVGKDHSADSGAPITYCGGPHFAVRTRCAYSRDVRHVGKEERVFLVVRSRRCFTCGLSRVWRAIVALTNFYRGQPYRGYSRGKGRHRKVSTSSSSSSLSSLTSPLFIGGLLLARHAPAGSIAGQRCSGA